MATILWGHIFTIVVERTTRPRLWKHDYKQLQRSREILSRAHNSQQVQRQLQS